MASKLKLKHAVLLSISVIVMVLVASYSLLAAKTFISGMDNIIMSNLTLVVEEYAVNQKKGNIVHRSDYIVTAAWEEQPESVRKVFQEPFELNKLYKSIVVNTPEKHPRYFLIKTNFRGQEYYVSFRWTRASFPSIVGKNMRENIITILLVVLITIIVFAIILRWIFVKISNPIQDLGGWARQLNEKNLAEPIPDFYYPELNQFAELVRTSLSSAQAGIDREQAFLRYTSHELRTPLAVLRNNIELLKKSRADLPREDTLENRVLERIDHASSTMKDLTETLLWLSREELDELPKQPVQIDSSIEEQLKEMDYLLAKKNVSIKKSLIPITLELSETAVRIVVSNLIRNAFQHTWEGLIEIELQGSVFTITNSNEDQTKNNQDLGFGLGLKLTRQLSEKLGWHFASEAKDGNYRVILDFNPQKR